MLGMTITEPSDLADIREGEHEASVVGVSSGCDISAVDVICFL